MEHQPSRQYNRGISAAQLELIQLNRQLENENRMLKFSLRKYDSSLRETESEAASTQKWISELRTELRKTNATLSESEAELHAKQAEKEGLQQELNEMKSQVAALEERLSQVDEPPEVDPEIGAIEKEIEDLKSQVEEQKSRKRTTETLLEEKRAELETQKKSLEWKETELKTAVEIATFLQQKMDEMDRESRLSAASVSPSAPSAGLASSLPVALNGTLSQCNDSMEVGVDGADEAKGYHRVGWSYSSDVPSKSFGILNLNRPIMRRPSTRFSDTVHQRGSVNARDSRQGGCNISGSTSSTPTKRKHPPIVWDETELSKEAPVKRHLAQIGTFNEPCDSGSMSSVMVRDSGDVTTSSTVTRKRTEHPPIVWRDTDDKKHGVIRLAMSGGAISTGKADEKITTNSRASTNGSTADDAEASMKREGTAARSADDDISRPAVVQAGCTSSTPAQKKHPPIIWDEAGPSRNVPVQSPAAGNVAASIAPRKHPAITCNPSSSPKDTAGVIDMPKRTNTAKSSLESIHPLTVDETDLPSASPALKDPLLIRENTSVPMKETLDHAANAKKRPPIKWP